MENVVYTKRLPTKCPSRQLLQVPTLDHQNVLCFALRVPFLIKT